MTISISEAIATLQSGKELSWSKFDKYESGNVQLRSSAQRRVFRYLIDSKPETLTSSLEHLFDGLVAAWSDTESDPATAIPESALGAGGPWRLARIETYSFGGLNTFGGPVFDLQVDRENWCLEGFNGSGKTSLASAVIWAMTGQRIREQEGPTPDMGYREPVYNENGKKIGQWPPLVSYPKTTSDLDTSADVWVRLTYEDPENNSAIAYRKVISAISAEPINEVDIDQRLQASPQLIETGLLMPARLGHIGFGDKSQSLYEALKILTGLDRLADISSAAAELNNRGRKFLKYAKDKGAEGLEKEFLRSLQAAILKSEGTDIDLSKKYEISDKDVADDLLEISRSTSSKAGLLLDTLKSEIAPNINTEMLEDRQRVKLAVGSARHLLSEKTNGIAEFQAWAALRLAGDDQEFQSLGTALNTARADLENALSWHQRQQLDEKLRLKALAAKFYVLPEEIEQVSICPLCESHLDSDEQALLAEELANLHVDYAAAEQQIGNACNRIEKGIRELIPQPIKKHFDLLANMVPAAAYEKAVRARFSQSEPFCNVLHGISRQVEILLNRQKVDLPEFEPPKPQPVNTNLPAAQELLNFLESVSRIYELSTWWSQHRDVFLNAWRDLLGKLDADGNWPPTSLEGKVETLEHALEKAEPLDEISKELGNAIAAAEKWAPINEVQKTREDIAKGVEILKDLRHLVAAETARSIQTLSGRVSSILEEIRLRDRFSYQATSLGVRKTVTVQGSFDPGLHIDGALVANTSWLRALLWSFIFALREQTIQQQGGNSFPLMVLDDPQSTFDPKNKRKWSELICRMANSKDVLGLQLFLTTHERQFFEMVSETEKLVGEVGLLIPPMNSSPVVHVINGTLLERKFAKARETESDEDGFSYVASVRVYIEDLLKILLRPEAYEISGPPTLGKMRSIMMQLRKDHISPYTRRPFQKLIDNLEETKQKEMKIINLPHHEFDGTIGLAQAYDVHKFWDDKLNKAFSDAFACSAAFDAYSGESRLFPWEKTVAEFPPNRKNEIEQWEFSKSGVAAAAKTECSVGNGEITLKEWQDQSIIRLFNHDLLRLNANTLDPIASFGDILIVSNYASVESLNLVVAAFGGQLLARRFVHSEQHADIAVLTAQSTDPSDISPPIIAPLDKLEKRKIVGTLFSTKAANLPEGEYEISPLSDISSARNLLVDSRLFEVKGRSMEPLALDGQFVITRDMPLTNETIERLEGHLVIAIGEDGATFFKRLRSHGSLIVLESINSDGITSSEIMSKEQGGEFPVISAIRSVAGVLYELP